MRRTFPQLLGTMFLLTFVLPALSQDIEIKGVQITLQTQTTPVEIVTLENRRESPLVAWQIAFMKDDRPSVTHTSNHDSRLPPSGFPDGAIRPHERQTIELDARIYPEPGSPNLRLAVFEDGYMDGVFDAIAAWQQERRERAAEAEFWIRAFERMPVGDDKLTYQYLEIQLAERTAQSANDSSGIRNRLSQILKRSLQPGELIQLVRAISQEAARQNEVLTRRPAKAITLESSEPVAITSRRELATSYAVVIRNLRDVAIEAVGFELLDPISRRPTSGQGADYCGTVPGTPTGKIGARESRTFLLHEKFQDVKSLPIPRITYVMFDDLTYEGSSSRRAEILAHREQRADDIAHVLSVRAEAASKPPGELVAFINAKRIERARALAAEGNQSRLRDFDDLILVALRGPNAFRADTPYFQHLETHRKQLLRHVN
jgi:hypothetical protein